MSEDSQKRAVSVGAIAFWLSFVAGVTIWLAWLPITGHREPWDSNGDYYIGAMLLVGLVCGALAPRRLWLTCLGMYLGQLLGSMLVTPRLGPLAPLGLLCFLPAYCLVTLAGAAFTAMIRDGISSHNRRRD